MVVEERLVAGELPIPFASKGFERVHVWADLRWEGHVELADKPTEHPGAAEPWCEATASYFIGRWHVSSATPRRNGNEHNRAACNAGEALSTTTQRTPTRWSGRTAFASADATTWGLLCRAGGHPRRSSWCRLCSARGSRPPTEGRHTMRTSTPRRWDCGRCPPPRATSSSGAPGACDQPCSCLSHCKRFTVSACDPPSRQVSEEDVWRSRGRRTRSRAATAPEPMSLHTNLGPDAAGRPPRKMPHW